MLPLSFKDTSHEQMFQMMLQVGSKFLKSANYLDGTGSTFLAEYLYDVLKSLQSELCTCDCAAIQVKSEPVLKVGVRNNLCTVTLHTLNFQIMYLCHFSSGGIRYLPWSRHRCAVCNGSKCGKRKVIWAKRIFVMIRKNMWHGNERQRNYTSVVQG